MALLETVRLHLRPETFLPEPNEWNVMMNLDQKTRETLYPTDDEGDD